MRRALPALLLAAMTLACGGEGGSSPPPTQTPPANPLSNPCPAQEIAGAPITPALRDLTSAAAGASPKDARSLDGSTRWRVLDDLWINRQAEARRRSEGRADAGPPVDRLDVGSIAVLQDEGDLIVAPNPWDLRSTGLRFTPNAAGGYDVRRTDGAFRQTLGTRLTLSDDDTEEIAVPFAFNFYGRRQSAAFVNSDGNITFGEGDTATSERNVARLLSGPPRVAPFLADLDPSAGGGVYVHAATDQYTVTWCGIHGFDSSQVTTVQATLLPDGGVDMTFGGTITLDEAVVGLTPGATTQFAAVDFSASSPSSGGTGAVGERFAAFNQLDTVAIARKFYRTHSDSYDQLVVWLDTSVVRDAFAYESTIGNHIRGLGIDDYNLSSAFGSAGRLESISIMDALPKYRDDPAAKVLNEATTLAVLAHEVAHRWLAFFTFRDYRGEISDELLGRDRAHWSFFMDTDASVMEGNDIQDLGGGSFRTVGAMKGYSALDLYAMGLLAESEVPPFFYVESPVNVSPARSRESAPTLNVTMNGTRRDVLIQDIVAANGPRQPSVGESPRLHTQAFIYVAGAGRTAAADQIDKLDRIRRQWESFFVQATGGRMRVETVLR
jgi:hypothetical protein